MPRLIRGITFWWPLTSHLCFLWDIIHVASLHGQFDVTPSYRPSGLHKALNYKLHICMPLEVNKRVNFTVTFDLSPLPPLRYHPCCLSSWAVWCPPSCRPSGGCVCLLSSALVSSRSPWSASEHLVTRQWKEGHMIFKLSLPTLLYKGIIGTTWSGSVLKSAHLIKFIPLI